MIRTILILGALLIGYICFGQSNEGIFLLKNQEYATATLKALNKQLNFSPAEYTAVKTELSKMAETQEQLLKDPQNQNSDFIAAVQMRQGLSFENYLKGLVGATRYQLYVEQKNTITADAVTMRQ